nr:MAG TPA: hypothetical protein [Caudoviricetes sp.]
MKSGPFVGRFFVGKLFFSCYYVSKGVIVWILILTNKMIC